MMTPDKVNELIEFQERAALDSEGELSEYYKQTALCLRHYHTLLSRAYELAREDRVGRG